MQYREFGDLDWQVSALGFGAMRLPEDDGEINEAEAIEMIRYAIDNGVNYVDTAWPYHGGESESLVAKALKDGYREEVKVATKMPSWELEKKEDLDKYLNQQLERLEVEKIDFYLLHALDQDHWQNYKDIGLDYVFNWIEKMKEEGKIDQIGFSFHDDYDLFEELVDSYDWDFCQIQYNYIDTEFQAGKKGLKYADENDIPVVVMEPLRGGSLAGDMPEEIEEIIAQSETKRSAADWALQWLWNQPEVAVVLSGMSTLEQVKENVESADNSGVGILSDQEEEIVAEVANKYEELVPVNCTGCGYCVPCPTGVRIPKTFAVYNESKIFNSQEAEEEYENLAEGQQASACVECGQCEEICPQNIEIIERLTEAHEYLTA
ncbi:aldo/keto reductase [Halanaerobacter jeridensis]|uniref:Aldo/keto reductase-like oxidoreductase n=1 Tax=Halanaerobacter jeridensis TaxID=706427 RepID=A0A938XXD8_9FIRM|nr:aldo/keto reductase [Halanaerobacter jeridensis]MBM7558011.1 putative aldo/keto reductase-like oxidoreductase [Halanaerobacter jeridensis]